MTEHPNVTTGRHHKGGATTKGKVMQDENTPKLSKEAADTVFGQPANVNDFDRDLYELRKLADRVLAAVASAGAQEMAFRGARETLPYEPPALEFDLPMPSWEKA